jgi:hypothetical protein
MIITIAMIMIDIIIVGTIVIMVSMRPGLFSPDELFCAGILRE